jgi:hypothetical protein
MISNKGIYTLANDILYDQLVALITSIRNNYNEDIPICIIPYDENLQKIKSLDVENVFIFDDSSSINKWSNFASQVWGNERFASQKKSAWYHGSNTIRKLCSFDGPFDHFIYIDSDELVMSSLESCFEKLAQYDCVFDDWEHRKKDCFLDVDLITRKYSGHSILDIKKHCHCSDFFAAKSSLLDSDSLGIARQALIDQTEINFINQKGWWDEVYLFSYLSFKFDWKIFNYTLSDRSEERIGNIAGVDPFVERNYVLYNKQGLKPVHRVHYMGYRADEFRRLCCGEDVGIPHRDVFLHYRFLEEPEAKPKVFKKVDAVTKIVRLIDKLLKKLSRRLGN